MTGALVFLAVLWADWVWARYIAAIAAKRRWAAAAHSGVIVLLSGFTTISFVENRWMLFPAVLGAMAGTALGVRK